MRDFSNFGNPAVRPISPDRRTGPLGGSDFAYLETRQPRDFDNFGHRGRFAISIGRGPNRRARASGAISLIRKARASPGFDTFGVLRRCDLTWPRNGAVGRKANSIIWGNAGVARFRYFGSLTRRDFTQREAGPGSWGDSADLGTRQMRDAQFRESRQARDFMGRKRHRFPQNNFAYYGNATGARCR